MRVGPETGFLLLICWLSAGCGGGKSGRGSSCGLPNGIVGYAYVPDPNVVGTPTPPSGALIDPQAKSDIIVTASSAVPVGYLALRGALVAISGTQLTVRTGDFGLFNFAALPRGTYTLTITAEGREPLQFSVAVCDATERVFIEPSDTTTDPGGADIGDSSSDNSGGSDDSDSGDGASSAGGDESSSAFNRVPGQAAARRK